MIKFLNVLLVLLLAGAVQADDSAAADASPAESETVAPQVEAEDNGASQAAEEPERQAPQRVVPERLRAHVISTRPTDPGAFTQGLEFDGRDLIESTGRYGESTLRRVIPATGQILTLARLPERFFGEGCTVVGDRIYQLTWRENTLLVWDKEEFELLDSHRYDGEGWGLAWDPDNERFLMTDGSDRLFFRDYESFEITGSVRVTANGEPVSMLNELEYVNGELWANVFQQNVIVRIDPDSGAITGIVDASGLLSAEERAALREPREDVLNGIAFNPRTSTFYITGKRWPKMFEVVFLPRD